MSEQNQGKSGLPATIEKSQKVFEMAVNSASEISVVQNASAAFKAVGVVTMLRQALSDEVVKAVFMPLMNTKIGFLTDRTGKPNWKGETKPLYTVDVVRDAIIDAVSIGLLPTGNQFNILAERMYPTKEGYTALLSKIGCKYLMNIGIDKGSNKDYAEIPVQINYSHNGEKNALKIDVTVKKDSYASMDALKGKAERKAKKQLYEYITGCDLGDGDEDSTGMNVSQQNNNQSNSPKQNIKPPMPKPSGNIPNANDKNSDIEEAKTVEDDKEKKSNKSAISENKNFDNENDDGGLFK